MSDEFITLATKEILEHVTEISNILNSCENSTDISLKADVLQKHTHSIKGLAPMIGKKELGSLSASLDMLLKKIMDGVQIEGVFDILKESLVSMKASADDPHHDFNIINNRIKDILSTL
jgi:HPt (histidine-containing phosphotransfer) domain-containing protein